MHLPQIPCSLLKTVATLIMAGHKVIYWGKEEKRGRLKFLCPAPGGKYECLVRATCSRSQYVRTFYLNPNQDYRLMRLFPRGTALW